METHPNIAISVIQAEVARSFGISLAGLLGKRRHRLVARPRQVAMYFASRLTRHSLSAIGRRFDRDHTTVGHAIGAVRRVMDDDPDFRDRVLALEITLGAR